MHRIILTWLGAGLIGYSAVCASQQHPPAGAAALRATLNRYCVGCHNDTLLTAGLSLQGLDPGAVGADAAIWEKVLRKLNGRSMPPSGMPRPAEPEYEGFAAYLESALDRHAAAAPRPGRPSMRRLNRNEYTNAIRDLFGVEINVDSLLPADDSMYGFDNVGDVLTLSPLLAEQYLTAARKIRYQVLGAADMQPEFHTYSVPMYLMQDEWLGEDFPIGTRGGISFVHHFPMDGEYLIQVRLQRNSRDYIRGLINKPHRLDVRVDGVRVALLTIGGEKLGRSSGYLSTSAQGDVEQEQYERHGDEALKVRYRTRAGVHKVTVTFLQERAIQEDPLYTGMSIIDYAQYKGGVPGVATVEIGGPFDGTVAEDSPARRQVFLCRPAGPEDEACARRILAELARRAYRGQSSGRDVDRLMDFFRMGRADGGFDGGIGLAMERILAGPKFLFVTESSPPRAKPGSLFRLPDLELATRLSLFLWSSIPDEALLAAAESGTLRDPAVLEQQLRRMLEDPRSMALVDNFAGQWLYLRNLNAAAPDGELFPYFDDNLRYAFRRESELFFEYVLKEDRPLLELLDADYTFINERLAVHYGIPGVYGGHFRKISLSDGKRGGLLGQGSILTVTSYANRTAPTIRGKWILENILGAPPPPPPPNVPGLRDRNDEGQVLNMRQRMEQHRANPVCASCHKVMDPLGFALENYDAIGKWRTVDASAGTPIDATGALPDGTAFEGPGELREVLVEKRREDFIITVVEKLMTYALGRGIEHTDYPVIRGIMREAAPEDYRLKAIIKGIIDSTPFKMRRVPDNVDI